MKIGEIARRTGLKIETIRFYEAEGLIAPPSRSVGNYRVYHASQLDRLSFVKRSRDLGFTLDQVRALLRLSDDPHGSCAEACSIAADHIDLIDRKLADLAALRAQIAEWGGTCRSGIVADCKVIDALSQAALG